MSQKRKTGSNVVQQGPSKRQKPQKPTYLFEPRPDWHAATLPDLEHNEVKTIPPSWITDAIHKRATELLETENATYSKTQVDSSHRFLSTIMSSGTLEDKISALTLLVQESPLHTMKAFDNLLGLARKRSRNQALMAVAALKDLLGQGAVLPERKLRAFAKQPELLSALQKVNPAKFDVRDPLGVQDVHLILWAYEDWLKRKYFELLQILESWCNDEVEYARSRAVTYVWELLRDKPEQEDNLLRLLVDRLSDSKIASRASHLLLQLQNSHPAMKSVIVESISERLFRQSEHAKYYAVITLNQTVLSQREQALANSLLDIYFSLFVQLLKAPEIKAPDSSGLSIRQQGGGGKPGKAAAKKRLAEQRVQERSYAAGAQARDKLMAQVLTGVNRAFLFADATSLEGQIDMLFRITHSANFNTAVQALILLQRITSSTGLSERYYRTLYESLLDPRLINSSKQVMYLNLVYKSLKADVDIKRVQAFVKRLLQVLNLHEPPFVCSVLYLISELTETFPSIRRMLTDPEIDDEDEEHFYDAPEDGEEDQLAKSMQSAAKASIQYDPRKRDPTHANASATALWDILPSTTHYHPSVAVFADAIVSCGARSLPPKPDPAAHSLLHFLDKFMYRNPKTKAVSHGTSIMQPSAGSAAADLLVKPSSQAAGYVAPVNNEAFWQKKVEDVAPDDIFFHSYFNKAGKKRHAKKATKELDSDESGEDEIWQAIANSRPEVEGPGSDDDLSMGDLDSAYGDSADDGESNDGGIDLGGEEDDSADLDMESGSEDGIPDLESDDGDAFFDDEDEVEAELAVDEESDKEKDSKGGRNKRKKLKQLPTFASADDYAKLLADEPDDV